MPRALTTRRYARKTLIAGLLAALTLAVIGSPAWADTVTVGDLALNAGTADLDGIGPSPVFQGDAAGNYTLSSPVTGTITSWSFRSGPNAVTGHRYVLRVLHSVDVGGSIWRVVGTSAPAAVGNTGGLDLVQGPFPTSLAIQPGERIALQPIDDGNTPIVVGAAGFDGIRYFSVSAAPPDGSASMLAPGAEMDNGQVVPIQATVSFTPPPPPPPPPIRTLTVTTSGSGTGTIAGAGVDCGGGAAHHACSAAYPDGTKVTLTATPSGASRFGGFTGGGCPAATPCTVTLNANQTVDGRFDAIPHPRKRKPRFLRFSLAPHAIRAAPVPPMVWPSAANSKWGTLIRFRLSDSAAVEFRVDECLPKPKRARAPCYRPQRADSFAINARRGLNVLRFTGFVTRLGHCTCASPGVQRQPAVPRSLPY